MLKKVTPTGDFPPVEIKLGDYVRDTISGFTGIVTCRTEWLYQCLRYGVTPTQLGDDGKLIDTYYFDEGQLEIIEKPESLNVKEPVAEAVLTGGDRPNPQRHPDPRR
jgi:hypothetical protein